MGGGFTNVQVLGGSDPAETRARVIDALRTYRPTPYGAATIQDRIAEALRRKLGQVDEARAVLVGPAQRWIGVYDEASESQDERLLDGLAAALSKAARTPALTVLMHGGALVKLGLFAEGRAVARFDSNPGYFLGPEDETDGPAPRPAVDVAPWQGLLAPGRSADELAALFGDTSLALRAWLERFAPMFGFALDRLTASFRALDDHADGYERLDFGAPPAPPAPLPSGPPRLVFGPLRLVHEATVGASLSIVADLVNRGGPCDELAFLVRDSPAIVPRRVYLDLSQGLQIDKRQASLERDEARGGWIARFPSTSTGMVGQRNARIEVDAIAPGEHELTIACAPIGPGVGSAPSVRVVVHPAPRVPLRMYDRDRGRPHLLLALDRPWCVAALASFDTTHEDAARRAVPAIERWCAAFPAGAEWGITVCPARPDERSHGSRAQGDRFFASRRWSTLQSELATSGQVTAHLDRLGGFGFGTSAILLETKVADDRQLPTLLLWRDVRNDDASAARTLGRALIDELFAPGDGVQAAIVASQRQPSLDSTTYEGVCRTGGSEVFWRTWLTRWLRAVTDDWFWLGPALLDRLGDRAALDQIAEVVPGASGVRARLRAGRTLDELEHALAPILADARDRLHAIDDQLGRPHLG